MASKEFDGQYDDEEVLMVFRKHPIVMRRGLIYASFAVLLGVIPSFFWVTYAALFGGLAAGLLLSLLIMLPAWVKWYVSVYIVTSQRFVQNAQNGFFDKKVIDIALNQIQMVNYEVSGIQATLLGFGTMVVQTNVGDLVMKNIHKPVRVQQEMLSILRERGIAVHNSQVESETE